METSENSRYDRGEDLVTAEAIADVLHTNWAARTVCYEKTLGSTNGRARQLAEEGAVHGTLVTAECQTAGRGRRGRNWYSPEGSGIWMSMVLRPDVRPDRVSMLTIVAAMAVYDALSGRVPGCAIKWPNDMVADGKKVCGILTELSADMNHVKYVILGVGINVNTGAFPGDIDRVAASLHELTGKYFKRSDIIADVWKAFEGYYELFMKTGDLSELMESYNKRLIHRGQLVRIEEGGTEYEAIAQGIDAEGRLLVQKADGQLVPVISGEVSVRGVLGYV